MDADGRRGYRLVAVDVDGTLVGQGMEPSPRVAEAIRRAAEAGVHISLASGRAFPSVLRYASSLALTAPLICYQGAEIREPADGRILHRVTLSRDLVREALVLAEKWDLEMTIHLDDTVYLQGPRHEAAFYDWAFGLPARPVEDLRQALYADPLKFLAIGEPAQLDAVEPVFRAQFQGRLQMVRSHRLFLEGVGLGVSKGSALARVAGFLGVRQEETVAVGDQDNDVSMMRSAGLGVAMGNAPAEVQAQADVVAPPLEEDGLAWAIERFVLGERGQVP